MSFKQRSSPLQQNASSLFGSIAGNIIPPPMTAAQIAYSNTPAGAAAAAGLAGAVNTTPTLNANQLPGYYNSPEPASNATQDFGPNSWITQGQQAAAATATAAATAAAMPVSSTRNATSSGTVTRNRSTNKGQNWFGAVPTNTINGGPQSVMQGTHGRGLRRVDSHNTNIYDRTNGGQMFSDPAGPIMVDPNNMNSPFPQLKKEQMEYNKISPKAFSNSGTIEKMMGKAVPNSPFMQMVDPLTGNQIDPTMNTNPNAPAPVNTGMPIPPPLGVQVPTTPIYDINQ